MQGTQEIQIQSPGWEDPLEKEMATQLPGKSHGQRSLAGYSPRDCKRVRHDLATNNNNGLRYAEHVPRPGTETENLGYLWVALPFSRGSYQSRDWTWVSCTAGRFFTVWATREAPCVVLVIIIAGLDEAQAGIKIAGRNTNNLRYADDTTLMAESEEELKSLLMKVKEESEKVGVKLNIHKTKIMASGPITSGQTDGEIVETVADFILGGSKITTGDDYSHESKRQLLLGRKVMTNLDSILKSKAII